ncbi:MAG: orotidine-5'-phosphate decarboxylase [Mycobacteriales bacterium]
MTPGPPAGPSPAAGPGAPRAPATAPFGERLSAAVATRGALVVGIDPHLPLLRDWGLPEGVAGLERFALTVVEALADRVAVLKPQSAFFERFGSRGVAVLERVLAGIRAAGALAVLDVKRGDIGSTMAGYAGAYTDPASPLAADALTASPYLGFGSLRPLLGSAYAYGAGVFVLALTSNPEGGSVQRATGPDGRTVAQRVLDDVAEANAAELAVTGGPLGSVGAVVGATLHGHGHRLDHLRGPILAPGLGAQGASAADLPAVFGAALPDVLPAASREVLGNGPDLGRLRAAAARLAAEVHTIRSQPVSGSGGSGTD